MILLMVSILSALTYAVDLDVNVYTLKEDGSKDFGDITAKPGALINAFVQIENTNQNRDEDEIEDITVTLTIQDIDDGSDIEEEFDSFDLKPRRQKSLPFTFKVPLQVEDKNYDIKIEVEGTENNDDFSFSEYFSVNIDKKENELYFEKLTLNPASVSCNDVAFLELKVYNIGNKDEEVDVAIKNDAFKFSARRAFSPEKYPGDDVFETKIPIKVPNGISSGKYAFSVTFNYASKRLFYNKNLILDVACGELSEQQSMEEPESEQPFTEPTVNTKSQKTEQVIVKKSQNSLIPLIMLMGASVIAIVFIVILSRK